MMSLTCWRQTRNFCITLATCRARRQLVCSLSATFPTCGIFRIFHWAVFMVGPTGTFGPGRSYLLSFNYGWPFWGRHRFVCDGSDLELYLANGHKIKKNAEITEKMVLLLGSQLIRSDHPCAAAMQPYIKLLWLLVMVALLNRADHYIFMLWFVLLSSSFFFFPRLISAVGDWMFTILWHMVWP